MSTPQMCTPVPLMVRCYSGVLVRPFCAQSRHETQAFENREDAHIKPTHNAVDLRIGFSDLYAYLTTRGKHQALWHQKSAQFRLHTYMTPYMENICVFIHKIARPGNTPCKQNRPCSTPYTQHPDSTQHSTSTCYAQLLEHQKLGLLLL